MRIPTSQLIRRYLVKFNKKETDYLRGIGFLHPHCAEESEMWMTIDEIDVMKKFPCFGPGEVDEAVRTQNLEWA